MELIELLLQTNH